MHIFATVCPALQVKSNFFLLLTRFRPYTLRKEKKKIENEIIFLLVVTIKVRDIYIFLRFIFLQMYFFFNNENQGRYIIILINKLVIDAKFHKSKCHCFINKVIHRYRQYFHCEMISPILQ